MNVTSVCEAQIFAQIQSVLKQSLHKLTLSCILFKPFPSSSSFLGFSSLRYKKEGKFVQSDLGNCLVTIIIMLDPVVSFPGGDTWYPDKASWCAWWVGGLFRRVPTAGTGASAIAWYHISQIIDRPRMRDCPQIQDQRRDGLEKWKTVLEYKTRSTIQDLVLRMRSPLPYIPDLNMTRDTSNFFFVLMWTSQFHSPFFLQVQPWTARSKRSTVTLAYPTPRLSGMQAALCCTPKSECFGDDSLVFQQHCDIILCLYTVSLNQTFPVSECLVVRNCPEGGGGSDKRGATVFCWF